MQAGETERQEARLPWDAYALVAAWGFENTARPQGRPGRDGR